MPSCAKCGSQLPADIKVFRQTLCPQCSAYLHSCIQCALHDPGAHNQCREPQAEFVGNREKANFCDFFQLAGGGGRPGRAGGAESRDTSDQRAREARTKLEALFKKPTDDASPSS